MSNLLEQIRADAEARLPLLPGRHPFDELERYQKFLRLETHRLKLLHRGGAAGREICQARAGLVDEVLARLFQALPHRASSASPSLGAILAIGGYGRGELSPGSDIDIVLLHADPAPAAGAGAAFAPLLEPPVLSTLFPKLTHAVRSVADCVSDANGDFAAKTAYLEARRVCGDARLFARFEKAFLARCVRGREREYFAARLADQEARRSRHGSSVCLQEPNVKSGCGGLRDYQSLLWMAFFKYRSRTLAELEERELISALEREQLEAAYDFLLRVRTELHLSTERPVDVLSKSVQPGVAHRLGYHERSLSRRIERFMRDYYLQARAIHLITRTVEQRLALLPQPKRLPSLEHLLRERRKRATYVVDGFKFVDGEIHAATKGIFREQPARLMRAFRHAQQRGLTLHPELAQLIRGEVGRLGPDFRNDVRVHQTFLEILNQRGNVAPVLRAMHEVGLLGAYLPAFGRLTCLVQHEFFHQFTTDEHTLVCLEKLDAIAAAKAGPLAAYAEIFHKEVERPYVLYLALLLHDAGKARHVADHSEKGSHIAAAVAKRLRLDAATAHALRQLVRQHLAMVSVSQRRDLDEPAEIRRFATEVGSIEQLNLLTLLTIADSLGTSDKLWNGFKDTLLMTLYRRTRELLLGGAEFLEAEARQRERVAVEVRSRRPGHIADDEVAAHFERMPARYFLLRETPQIVADLELVHEFLQRALSETGDPLEPVCLWQHEPDRGYSRLRVATWDRTGLFGRVCGALTAAGLNILSAEIFTRDDNIAIDTFCVIDAANGALVELREQERFVRHLRDAVCEGADLEDLITRRRPAKPRGEADLVGSIPTTLRFDNQAAPSRTVIELETEDRVGLLHAIARSLSDLGLDISVAKICTERGAASDSFYVSELDGTQVENAARQQQIERRLLAALAALH